MSRDYDRIRSSSTERGYGREWFHAAKLYKRENPWCRGCAAIGLAVRTHTVDHIRPHKGDRLLMWDIHNWQPACEWHHTSIKQTLELEWALGRIPATELRLDSKRAIELTRARHRPAVGLDGFDIDGT